MKIGVLGTGTVGETIAGALVAKGHEVKMGSREASKSGEWAKKAGKGASGGTFADAAAFGELVFNCTGGEVALKALEAAGAKNLDGKTLIDVANPLDASKGFPPTVTNGPGDSLAERIQKAFPKAKVVKTLNTVNTSVMIAPQKLANGEHAMFLCGNDAGAKKQAQGILESFGWKHIHDLGDLSAARGMEAYLGLWLRLMGVLKTPTFNVQIVR